MYISAAVYSSTHVSNCEYVHYDDMALDCGYVRFVYINMITCFISHVKDLISSLGGGGADGSVTSVTPRESFHSCLC